MIYLRELTFDDIKIINKWRNDVDLVDLLGANFRFINLETDENWFRSYQNNRSTQLRCVICDAQQHTILGLVSLTNIDYLNQKAELHTMIGEKECHNKGIGTLASKKMISHAFYNMNLLRIEFSVLEENCRSIHMHEKIGFIKEGLLRKCVFKNNSFKNMYIMSILKEEYLLKLGE